MCFKKLRPFLPLAFVILAVLSCAQVRKIGGIRKGELAAQLSIPSDNDFRAEEILDEVRLDSLVSDNQGDPLIMNAVKDELTGEMVAVDVISASKVVARFRNVAERFGKVQIEFDITVPQAMIESRWRLKFLPTLCMKEDSVQLDAVYITGKKYRDEQMRGYRRYEAFLASIITDSLDFIRVDQLEIFLQRHFPQAYAMKSDSSFVSDPVAENIFGVTRKEVVQHYTRHGLVQRNDRKIRDRDKMFRRYVKDSLISGGMRLDTVMTGLSGTLVYRYVQLLDARPGLRKVDVRLDGSLFDDGRLVCSIPSGDPLTFYISSLSTLADPTPRYVMKVTSRMVYDNTYAFIDFEAGSSKVDTLLDGNADELRRISRAVASVVDREELELDSLVVTASCSPEGTYAANSMLAAERSEAVKCFVQKLLDEDEGSVVRSRSIAENWEQFSRLAASDSLISPQGKQKIAQAALLASTLGAARSKSAREALCQRIDEQERTFSRLPDYRYLRQKVYPRLRTVRFDFYLHRRGMVKDTVHTTELDTVYLAGVEAMKNLDYKRAVELLRPYHDYNTALAYLCAGYNHSALADLEAVGEENAQVMYLKAVVLARLGRYQQALESYRRSAELDPSMVHRANLDPELSDLVRLSQPASF